MKILIVSKSIIPVQLYGGTQRVVWGLGKELSKLGHQVSFLVQRGSASDFASVIYIDESKPILEQIPDGYDVVHFHSQPEGVEKLQTPYVITMHGNAKQLNGLDKNTIFVSQNHASRYNAEAYVHNGLDWNDYSTPELMKSRNYFHFLGNAAWRVKNVSGAINVIKKTKTQRLKVLGGVRFNFKMGMRFTFSTKVGFEGMVGGQTKFDLLNGSKGLIFPVKWHEPFGLAIIESLYFGCPVFGTPYGSLPELVTSDFGYLSANSNELAEAVLAADNYSRKRCHEYAREEFNSKQMVLAYIQKYERVMAGVPLNTKPFELVNPSEEKWLAWE